MSDWTYYPHENGYWLSNWMPTPAPPAVLPVIERSKGMSEMLEKVARALWEIRPWGDEDSEQGIPTWDTVPEDWKAAYIDMARAAVRALREPTEEMLEAVDCGGVRRQWLSGRMHVGSWHAMIDSILSEAEGR